MYFFFNDPATTEIYTLSLHDALPISNKDLAEKAMQAAVKAFKTWRKVKPEVRADVLFKAAAIIRRRKHEFSALLTKEARSEEHTSELQSRPHLVCRLLLEKKNKTQKR